jgi:DNA-binding SARP family transcriptional activator
MERVGLNVDETVERTVESCESDIGVTTAGVFVRMLGPLKIFRDGEALPLPSSRKVRALLGYLVLAKDPVARSRLCDLLWDGPNDPRGELRWCLSKLRGLLDEPDTSRIEASSDTVSLRLDGLAVDANMLNACSAADFDRIDTAELEKLCAMFSGDFLEGLDLDRSPHFSAWLNAQRRSFRTLHLDILQRLVDRMPPQSEMLLPLAEKWVELNPFDSTRAALASRGTFGARKDRRLRRAHEVCGRAFPLGGPRLQCDPQGMAGDAATSARRSHACNNGSHGSNNSFPGSH